MKSLRVLVLMHEDLVPPAGVKEMPEDSIPDWQTEFDVLEGLHELGHEVRPLGVYGDLNLLHDTLRDFQPHVVLNLLEEFHGVAVYDQHVVSYMELMKQAYTGCNPRGLVLTHDKALSKKILSHHRVRVPRFKLFPRGRAVKKPKRLKFPLFVKSLTEEGSYGLSQASVVRDEEKLTERVDYLHHRLETDVIAEEYIRGREIYVAVFGHKRLEVLPFIELHWGNPSESSEVIATSKAKWDLNYQKKHQIEWRPAEGLTKGLLKKIENTGKQVYRALGLSGYARIDLRIPESGEIYVLEANPNPDLAREGELHQAAKAAGHDYHWLLTRVLQLAQSYEPEWKDSPL